MSVLPVNSIGKVVIRQYNEEGKCLADSPHSIRDLSENSLDERQTPQPQGNVCPLLVALLAPEVFHLENTKSFKGDSCQIMKPRLA